MTVQEFYPIFLRSNNICIDSRKILNNDMFFAFSGDTFNAAKLAEDAKKKGASTVIVEDQQYENIENSIFFVPSTLEFLQDLAIYHRDHLKIPIIGLTGSNGKTTTKEIIHSVLSQKFKVQYTFGNLNNHIGVPLSILSIKDGHEIAVIEMGANHQKEIEFLCKLAKPNIGYITNFGKAHLEGFGGIEGVIKGKSELYSYIIANGQTILLNEQDKLQSSIIKDYSSKITFGRAESQYDFKLINVETVVGLEYKSEKIISQLTGNYNFTNLCAAVTLGLEYNVPVELIKKAIENYQPQNMRSQIMQKNGKTLVLDTYNANPSSMLAAVENYRNFTGTKTLIMGDMLELGTESKSEHLQIINFAESLNFEKTICVGQHFKNVAPDLSFDNVQALMDHLLISPITTENVLLKGSRGIALERILEVL